MRSTNGKAIASLVLAIASIVTCLTPLAIVSVILAPQAKREIDASPQTQDGRGLAEAGHIIGWIVCGLMILGVIAFVVGMVISAAVDSSSTDSLSMAVG